MNTISVFLVVMCLLAVCYKVGQYKKTFSPLVVMLLKGMTTFTAGTMALYAAISGGGIYSWLIALGLFVCGIADMVLERFFNWGVLVFGTGHLLYIAAFLIEGRPNILSFGMFVLLLVVVAILAQGGKKKIGPDIKKYAVYGGVLGLMVALSIGVGPLSAIGAAFFAISDGLIYVRLRGKTSPFFDILCITLYYSAQFLLALSASSILIR